MKVADYRNISSVDELRLVRRLLNEQIRRADVVFVECRDAFVAGVTPSRLVRRVVGGALRVVSRVVVAEGVRCGLRGLFSLVFDDERKEE